MASYYQKPNIFYKHRNLSKNFVVFYPMQVFLHIYLVAIKFVHFSKEITSGELPIKKSQFFQQPNPYTRKYHKDLLNITQHFGLFTLNQTGNHILGPSQRGSRRVSVEQQRINTSQDTEKARQSAHRHSDHYYATRTSMSNRPKDMMMVTAEAALCTTKEPYWEPRRSPQATKLLLKDTILYRKESVG